MNLSSIIEDMSEKVLVNSSCNSNTKVISMAPCSNFKSKYRHNKPYKLYSRFPWYRHHQYKSFPGLCCTCINSGKRVLSTSIAFV